MDSETGLIFFGRRYYAPELGRWVAPDPQGFQDGPNLYAYLHHNPLNTIDLYGLEAQATTSASTTTSSHTTASTTQGKERSLASERTQTSTNQNSESTSSASFFKSAWNGISKGYTDGQQGLSDHSAGTSFGERASAFGYSCANTLGKAWKMGNDFRSAVHHHAPFLAYEPIPNVSLFDIGVTSTAIRG